MSDSEEDNFCYFGTPLEPYDEDAFPKKKPISVEEQVATDAQGRRRFHGAFTGGFSAGFYNTVGSLEGWTPSDFKSTRQEKALGRTQRPEDFMDDEDIGEFGIAPQTVRATSEYSTSKKRKKQVFSDGPIPGEPLLHSLLTSGNETIGYLLLKNIGLKGRKAAPQEETASEGRIYGCEMPKTYEISREEDFHQYVIPDIYAEYLKKPKDNTFGLGYVGLDKSHVNLFQSSKLVIRERNQKKVSIAGQAFGVGAFEDDDEDIYVKEDMSRYDFELTSEKASKRDTLKKGEKTFFEDFVASRVPLAPKETFTPPTIPHSFTGKHKQKRSRFEPLPQEEPPERGQMNAELRARYLGEDSSASPAQSATPAATQGTKTEVKSEDSSVNEDDSRSAKRFDLFSVSSAGLVFDRFVSASTPEDPLNILEVVAKTETTHGSQEMRDAARMKMFGPLTRISCDWQPCSLLCRRFNVPEPNSGDLNASKTRKRTKNLIFEYEKFADVASMDLKPGLWTKEAEDKVEGNAQDDETATKTDEVSLGESSIQPKSTQPVSMETEEADKEAPKDITEKIDVDKNVDLFKAVFLSSSESEDEEENEKEKTERSTEMKTSVLSDSLLPKIKPMKEGILSNMDFLVFDKPAENPTNKDTVEASEADLSQRSDDLSYGPVLPVSLPKNTSSTSNKNPNRDEDSDEWVEKSDRKNKSHKKKHKSKKSSHKKKHKHKDRS